ncbi:MAG: hypothetical protein KQH59_01910 [Desulfobulbaceae bacterium]|nr:hypothetical protein [Desulfobulbaceae bacterium]
MDNIKYKIPLEVISSVGECKRNFECLKDFSKEGFDLDEFVSGCNQTEICDCLYKFGKTHIKPICVCNLKEYLRIMYCEKK